MIVGVPKEIKVREYRVGMVPAGVRRITASGHKVVVQKGAGLGSGLTDDAYIGAGARILDSIEEIYEKADMITKVKEPVEVEYNLIRENQIIYTYLHLAADLNLTKFMSYLLYSYQGCCCLTIDSYSGECDNSMRMTRFRTRTSCSLWRWGRDKDGFNGRAYGGCGLL